MRLMKQIVLLLLVIIPLIISGASQVQGYTGASNHLMTCPDPYLSLTIEYTNYDDLDDDDKCDDFLGIFVIKAVNGQSELLNSLIHLYLEKPSGYTHYANFDLYCCLGRIIIIVNWYNTINEPGWYTFIVCFTNVENCYCRYYEASQMFDPPDEGPPGHPA